VLSEAFRRRRPERQPGVAPNRLPPRLTAVEDEPS
jgi:hypothetical protein